MNLKLFLYHSDTEYICCFEGSTAYIYESNCICAVLFIALLETTPHHISQSVLPIQFCQEAYSDPRVMFQLADHRNICVRRDGNNGTCAVSIFIYDIAIHYHYSKSNYIFIYHYRLRNKYNREKILAFGIHNINCNNFDNAWLFQRDNGGPILQTDGRGVYQAVGVIGTDDGCIVKLTHTVGTRIAPYMGWIKYVIGG